MLEWPVAMLLLALATGAAMRWNGLTSQSLWQDEFMSLRAATGHAVSEVYPNDVPIDRPDITGLGQAAPWWTLWGRLGTEVHPPVYALMLRTWMELFGVGDAALRMLSLLTSLVAIVFLFDAARLLHGQLTGVCVALLMALATPQVAYGQELRSYAPLLMFGGIALSAIARLKTLGPGWRRATALGAATLALPLTHYFAFGACVALGVYALLRLRGPALRQALVAFAVAGGVFTLAWGPFMYQQRHNTEHAWLMDETNGHLRYTIHRVAELPVAYLGGTAVPTVAKLASAALLLATPLLFKRRPDLVLPYTWLVCTMGFVVALDLVRSTTHIVYLRYTLLASLGCYMLLLGLIARLPVLLQVVLAAGLILFATQTQRERYPGQKLPWRQFGALLTDRAGPDDVVVMAPGNPPYHRDTWIWALSHYGEQPGPKVLMLQRPVTLAARQQAWLVSEQGDFPAELLPGWRPVEHRDFEGIGKVWKLEAGQYVPPPPEPSNEAPERE